MAENINNDREEEMEVDCQVNEADSDEEGGLRIDEDIYIPPPPKKTSELNINGPRLIITKIVNENFKSFAGIQVVGPFHKCFSAIVGPNGSGKSNVIDSMLFVFGYRASKIRSKKISVLIHNSSQHPNCNSCTVSVHFQSIIDKPGSDYEVVPASEFVISRKAFKDNSSHYELNKKKVQFKEIGKLLRSHGVDLDHNRFLILQGEVEQIALMKPKSPNENETGMLEFLEDIIGTVRYKEPLDKLCEKVEILTERRIDRLNRVKIVEKEKAALEKPMEDAVLYLKLENSITKLHHQLYSCKRLETTKQVAVQEKKTNELDKSLSNLVEEMNTIQKQKEETSKMLAEKNKKWASLQTQEDNLKAEIELIRKKDESLHAEIAEINKRRKENLATINTEKNKLKQLQQVPVKNLKDVEECEQLIKQHVESREQAEATLATLMSGLREKTEPLLNERSELEKELISLRKNVDEAKAAYDIQHSKLELYTSVEQKEKAKLENITSSLESAVKTLTERTTQIATLKKNIPITEKNLKDAQKELQNIQDKEIQMSSRLKNLRISYEETKSSMQASKSRNRILDALMREKSENRIPGIYGRLGDLGAIDSKYDIAISTACGPLDNIVVDTVNTAQDCITFLRQNDIGRATFIPLEKQQRFLSRCNEKIQTPENVPRLFDIIRVEDQDVLPAFYYALQDTLVARDLDQATRIAYGAKRFRVVTLKGELIELSGTMSGGGRTVFRGRMGQKVVRNEPSSADIEKMETDLNEVYEEHNRLKCKQQLLENQIHDLSTSLKDMIVDRDKFNIQMETLKGQKTLLEAQLKDQKKKVAESLSDPKKIQQMTKLVEDAKRKLEEVEKKSSAVERKVTNINRKIDEVSGDVVKNQQKKISDLNKLVEKIKGEAYRLQVDIKTAERNYKKTEQRIETLENDVQAMETKLREMRNEMLELEETWKSSLEQLEEVKEALTERDKETGLVKKELDERQSQLSQMKSMKIDIEQKLNDNKKQLKELQQQLSEYTKRLASLKLHNIPREDPEQLKELSEEEINELNDKTVLAKLQKVKEKLPSEIPNMQIIEDYNEKDQLYLRRVAELENITTERNNMREAYENVRRRRTHEFLTGFGLITTKLKEMYQMITLGGDAELELVDSLDPFSEGIVFSVRPPKKSWKNISNLSGGEKTLSSLALVFALHHYKPTPFYFMDEIDAALDFKNVSIVGNYIKERTKNAQFIIISLRSNMFELADYLVGIYKTYNCTKSVTVDVAKFCSTHGIAPPSQMTNTTSLYHQSQNLISGKGPIQTKENCNLQTVQTDKNASLRLNVSICSTPKKSQDTNGEKNSKEDRASGKAPRKKKRKLSDIAQSSLSTD